MTSINKYKEELIKAGFKQAKKMPNNFFKELMPYTALGVNLKECGTCICVVFGCGSTAFTKFKGSENALVEWGFASNDDITIRRRLFISDETDEAIAKRETENFFSKFYTMSKDEILALAQEGRRKFISLISEKLKPLGFKKKASLWSYRFSNGAVLNFNLYKRFGDEYRFDIYISRDGHFPHCMTDEIPFSEEELFVDWQLISEEEMNEFLDEKLVNYISEIISAGTERLGELPWVWEKCFCTLEKCEDCWVRKNYFNKED